MSIINEHFNFILFGQIPLLKIGDDISWNPVGHLVLTHCGIVMPYADKDLGKIWLR